HQVSRLRCGCGGPVGLARGQAGISAPGERHRKLAAPSLPRTGDPDTALVGFDKTLYQGQAQAQPAMTPGLRPVLLTKTFKHKRNKVSRNTLAGIFHLDNEIVTLRMTTHRYRAAGRRELDCIIEQVDERLAQSNSITGNNFVLPLAESEFDSDLARLR